MYSIYNVVNVASCCIVVSFFVAVPCFDPPSANWFNTSFSLMSNSFTLLGCGREQLRTLSVVDVTKSARLEPPSTRTIWTPPPSRWSSRLNCWAFTGHECAALASRPCWPKVISASFCCREMPRFDCTWQTRLGSRKVDSRLLLYRLWIHSGTLRLHGCWRTCPLARPPAPYLLSANQC